MSLESILNGLNFAGPEFHKQRVGKLTLGLSVLKPGGRCQVSVAPVLDKNESGRPQPGVKRYNYAKKCDFSLMPSECRALVTAAPKVMAGTYENPNPKVDEKYKSVFQVEHYPREGKSYFNMFRPERGGTPVPSIGITISTPKDSGFESNTFIMSQEEKDEFLDFVTNCAKNLPFYTALSSGICKAIRSTLPRGEYKGGDPAGRSRVSGTPAGRSRVTSTIEHPADRHVDTKAPNDFQPEDLASVKEGGGSAGDYDWDFR